MLDVKWMRQNPERVQQAAEQKGIDLSVAELLAEDDKRRSLLREAEELRYTRNQLAESIGAAMRQGETERAKQARCEAEELRRQLAEVESRLADAEQSVARLSLRVPNVVSPDTPIGRSDADNVVIRRVGEPPEFAFAACDHVTLGERLGLIDMPRGVRTAGSRNYYLRGAGVLLHRAVQQLALDLLQDKGYTLLDVPLTARAEAMTNAGFFPLGEDQAFRLAEEDSWLVGTSEVPLVSYHAGEIVDVTEPIRLAAASPCFRREVGSAGRDVHGLYRVHQFAKVEQVILCKADSDLSEQLLQEMTRHAEELLQLLELPYRVVAVCTGDLSQKNYKQYDLETWMPSRQSYGETHSASNVHDFQARRAHIRYRDEHGGLTFCHILNCTAVASPRILIPLLETHQREDGSVHIPDALRPYMQGIARLEANT